ncbi:sugar phosphate isomerase/epimerase [Streptomyces sp. A7024]|uniref:Sugar phosphate isomerase/epimerase n=1 Tax=Streptomyces coryli TaxID=1128680 RepID=A0A6G4UAH7_9ACTN|nr:sugar phosphate isomerase/epimerase family protein [Streptomyces coryli]NGN68696.1 sugar phosphate isomerase/epimerase [Streptomyces coryli]
MRLAFSTLGLPGLPVADVVELARSNGYQGVELRCHPEEPVHTGLGRLERADVVEEFAKSEIEILTLASYVKVAAPGDDTPVLTELREQLALAHDLGAAHVRVFPGAGDVPAIESDPTAVRRLAAVAPYAADLGVRVLLETHDSHPTGKDAARILEQVNHRSTGAIWDLMHPWRAGEEPADTLAALTAGPYLAYVQVKDASSAEDTTPLALGAGALPLAETLVLLTEAGWDGWLCWEYEKRWYPQAAELTKLLAPGREHLLQLLSYAS